MDSLSIIVGKPLNTTRDYQAHLNLFLSPIEITISEEKRLLLGRPFSSDEIKYAVKAVKKEKDRGPNGIQAKVLQEIIEYADNDLCDLLNTSRAIENLPMELNTRLIKLIPKNGDKLEVKNYIPLNMLNTMYATNI